MKIAPTLERTRIIIVNLSGRGDKDAAIVAEWNGGADHEAHG